MSENLNDMRKELESLREQNEQLLRRAANAEQARDTFRRDDLDERTSQASEAQTAQTELRHSQQLLRAVFDGALEPMVLTNDLGRYVDANPAACELYGLSREELIGRSIAEFTGAELVSAEAYRAFRELGHMRGQFAIPGPRGVRRLEYSSVFNVAEGLDLSVMRDVTARQGAEDALSQQRDRLEEAQAIAHVGSWTAGAGPDDAIVWSPECYRIFGVSSETAVTVASFFEQVHCDDRERVERASRDAFDGKAPYDIAHRITRPDGSVRWVQERAIVVRDELRKATHMVGTVQDITDRHLANEALTLGEAKLRESEAMLRITGQAARLGGWSIDLPDLRVTWSDEVCAILEVPPGTVPSFEDAMRLYPPEFRETIRTKIESCARDGTPFDLELQIITALSRRIWVRAIGRAERDVSGVITGLRGAFQDIDDRRKLQDQFRQAQKMEAIGRLAGGVAHDFNNILSVILSYSDLVLGCLEPEDPLRPDIVEIRTAGQRATALTRQLLAFSRQQVLEPRVVDLSQIVGAMKMMLNRLLGEDVDLTVLSPRPVCSVLVDPSQIEQVVMNLAVNARDAMPHGGKLTIETSNVSIDDAYPGKPADVPAGRFVMLAVTDSGEGMSEATRARIFEPFFTTKEQGKGTGLGLATVFGIVRQSGGYVGVYSELQHGTTFKIFLPCTDHVAAKAPLSEAPSAVLEGSETILLVEDEDQVRAVACAILRKHGYNVLETSNGGEALLASSDFPGRIDLLLTDVVMPRMNGRKLAEHLAPLRPTMKVLLASGYTDDAIVHHGVLDAGVAFLQKPFTPHALLEKVRDVLDADRRER